MATRYIAIVGAGVERPQNLSTQVANTTNLILACESPQLTLFVDAADQVVTGPDRGVHVIGHLFERADRPDPVKQLNGAEETTIRRSFGDSLTRNYWGGYCAFTQDEARNRVAILRDPSGIMPCFYLQVPGATVVCSDVETLLDAQLLSVEIDWHSLAAHLTTIDFPFSRTALVGVTELLAGHRLSISRKLDASPCWSPWDHVTSHDLGDDVAARLYDTIGATLAAWGNSFKRVLLGVSGGLDSSIVAEGLSRSRTDLAAYTMATNEAGGDERHYAQALTRFLDLPLEELFHNKTTVDFSVSTAAHLPRPGGGAFGQSHAHEQLVLGQRLKADAYFTGIGGDNVFCFMQSATPFLDRLKSSGPGVGAVQTLFDICKLTDCSIWDVLAMADRRWRRGNAYHWPEGKRRFLNTDCVVPSLPLDHAWLDAPSNGAAGKAVHIAMLARVQATLDSFSRKSCAPQIHPLLSQPIVEMCLQIPTWKWCAGGQNRSVARQAYAGHLPAEILSRRSKGSPDSFAFDVLQANQEQVRELLIGGQLDQRGFLDRKELETVLKPGAPISPPDHIYLYAIAEAEAWVRNWQERSRRRLA